MKTTTKMTAILESFVIVGSFDCDRTLETCPNFKFVSDNDKVSKSIICPILMD
jgi:hypothetical protein